METPRRNYKKNPGSGTEGYLNQLRLSTLYFSRLAASGKRFEIGVEVAVAGKFDDIVMHLLEEQQYCLVQAKHKQDESKRIILDDLLKTTTEYSLPKYFDSFLGLRQEELFKGGRLKYIVIYTNLKVDENVMKVIEPVEPGSDVFLHTLNVRCRGKESSLYRFNTTCTEFIEQLIDRISPICEVARKLAEQLVQRKKISINPNGIFHEFHALLVRDVFDLERQLFRESFLADVEGIDPCLIKLRFLLERILRSIMKSDDFSITELNRCIVSGKLKLMFEPGFLCRSVNQTKPAKDWIDYRVQRAEVIQFFDHLLLATDQPNFIELEAITKVEVFGLKEQVDEYMRAVFDQVDRWIRDSEGQFLNAYDWRHICSNSRARIAGKKWLLKSEEYQKSNPATGYVFERNTLLAPIEQFLATVNQHRMLVLAPYNAEVSASRVLQALMTLREQFVVFDAHCFHDFEDLESCALFLKNVSSKVMVIVSNDKCCRSAIRNARHKFNVLTNVKTIYIACNAQQEYFAEKLEHIHCDRFELGDMSRQSRQKLLEKKIILQQRSVQLHDLLSEEIALQLLDMEFISQLLMNQVDPIVYSFKYQCQLKGQYFSRTLVSDRNVIDENGFDQLLAINKAVILSNVPGMGKTTFLQNFIDRLYSSLPDHVICLMHLKFYTETLEEITKLNARTISVEDAIWHATKCFFAGSSRLGQVLFRNAILNTGKLIVLVDGYDSVINRYKISVEKASELFLQYPFRMRNLLIATRPHETEHLRASLPQARVVSLLPFDEHQCIEFLTRWWSFNSHLEANNLLQYLRHSYADWIVGSPFQIKLLAEIYQEDKAIITNFGALLERYLEKQFHESNQRAIQVMGIGQQRMAAETLKQAAHEGHCELAALLTFYPELKIDMPKFVFLLDIGLIVLEDNRMRFEHRLFQYYFAAEALMKGKPIAYGGERFWQILNDPLNRYLNECLTYHLSKSKNAHYREYFRRTSVTQGQHITPGNR
uniref:NACHT domain-containing protein n=1 Tax=Anopheles culicifacies TaxID=139723 RepID=A0A182M8J3_9DIPT